MGRWPANFSINLLSIVVMNFEDCYNRHMDAIKSGEIDFYSRDRIFTDYADIREHLETGNLSSTLVQQTAQHILSVPEQIGLWSLRSLMPGSEKKFKGTFLACLSRLGCTNEALLGDLSDEQLFTK